MVTTFKFKSETSASVELTGFAPSQIPVDYLNSIS